MVTGFGTSYDEQYAQYDSGVVKDNDLYDSSGYVRVGYISGNKLVSSVGGRRVTLYK